MEAHVEVQARHQHHDGATRVDRPVSDVDTPGVQRACAVRRAMPGDLDRIEEIEMACFPGEKAYSRRQLRYLAFSAHGTCLVETAGDVVRGFVMVLFRRGSTVAGIESLAVSPDHQGLGVGTRLLAAAERDMALHGAARARLEVAKGNTGAVGFYMASGYSAARDLPDYYLYRYNGSRDAYRMVKEL